MKRSVLSVTAIALVAALLSLPHAASVAGAGTPVVVDPGGGMVGRSPSLAIANGRQAIGYVDSSAPMHSRDSAGSIDPCRSSISVQNVGREPGKAILVAWGDNVGDGPLGVECTGLLVPGSSWTMQDSQLPSGSQSAALFSFTAKMLSELGLDDDLGFDDVVADIMCEALFFDIPGNPDEYARFKRAVDIGGSFAGLPMQAVQGAPIAASVVRKCPGDFTLGVDVTASYMGIGGPDLGRHTDTDRHAITNIHDRRDNHGGTPNTHSDRDAHRCNTTVVCHARRYTRRYTHPNPR
jgi:hypothetical protein